MGEQEPHMPDGAENFRFPDSKTESEKTEVGTQRINEVVAKIADLFEQGKIKHTDVYMEDEGDGDQEARKTIKEIHELFGWDSEKITDLEPLVIKELERRTLDRFVIENIDSIVEYAFNNLSRLKVGESVREGSLKMKPFSKSDLVVLFSEMPNTPDEIKATIQTATEEDVALWAEEIKLKMDSVLDADY